MKAAASGEAAPNSFTQVSSRTPRKCPQLPKLMSSARSSNWCLCPHWCGEIVGRGVVLTQPWGRLPATRSRPAEEMGP